jgi:hypothetical protein
MQPITASDRQGWESSIWNQRQSLRCSAGRLASSPRTSSALQAWDRGESRMRVEGTFLWRPSVGTIHTNRFLALHHCASGLCREQKHFGTVYGSTQTGTPASSPADWFNVRQISSGSSPTWESRLPLIASSTTRFNRVAVGRLNESWRNVYYTC